MLNLFQFKIACCEVCFTLTVVVPPGDPADACESSPTPLHDGGITNEPGLVPAAGKPESGTNPPAIIPFGTFGSCTAGMFGFMPRWFGPVIAAARAAVCIACTDCNARVVRAIASIAFARAWLATAPLDAPVAMPCALGTEFPPLPPRRMSRPFAVSVIASVTHTPSAAENRNRQRGEFRLRANGRAQILCS